MTPNSKPKTQIKHVVLDRRVSDGFYAYCLTLYTPTVVGNKVRLKYVDQECYGDMSYWERPNEYKRFDEALKELLERNNLTLNDVIIRECGVFSRNCYEVLEELAQL